MTVPKMPNLSAPFLNDAQSTRLGRLLARIAVVFGLIVACFTALGIFNNYTPVPYWDSWNGELEFIHKVSDGDHSGWFAQHNEHRIFLSRLLFWLDHTFFGGRAIFLFVCNFAFAAMTAIALYLLARLHIVRTNAQMDLAALGLALALCLSWIQSANFTWSFQTQFFLAQLIPLCSFFFLARAKPHGTLPVVRDRSFVIALIFGVLAMGTMANGVLTLPLMVVLSLFLRLGKARTAILVLATLVCVTLYFHDYHAVSSHSSFSSALIQPVKVVDFFIVFLGSPISHVFSSGGSVPLARLFGLVFIALALWQAFRFLRSSRTNGAHAALLLFLLYIGATATITTLGRYEFGAVYALTGRYTTPMLFAWAAMFILLIGSMDLRKPQFQASINSGALVVIFPFLMAQAPAIADKSEARFERMVMALAIELDVRDDELTRQIIPTHAPAIREIAKVAAAREMSAFSSLVLSGRGDQMGQLAIRRGRAHTLACNGHLDSIMPLPLDPDFVRIEGWLLAPSLSKKMTSIRIINEEGTTVGFSVYGKYRSDVAGAQNTRIKNSGFVGYVKADALGETLNIGPSTGGCEIEHPTAQLPYRIDRATDHTDRSVSMKHIISESGFSHPIAAPNPDQYIALGSNAIGDAGKGMIKIRLTRGEGFYFVSGPNASRQRIIVGENEVFLESSPQVVDWQASIDDQWTFLEFDHSTLPEAFDVRVVDDGDGWGEWSGVAVRKQD